MEDELRSLKLRDTNIAAYTQRFHELVLLCLEAVPTEKKKAKPERVSEGNKRKWENSQGGNRNNNPRGNNQGNTRHQQYNNQRQGNARALTNSSLSRLNTRDTNIFVTIVRNIITAIARQRATTAEGQAIMRKTVRGSQLQSVMNVEKRVTPGTIV
nr:hypothetical protein [Tanacetum cinerariifolium]GFC24883.1 hypothetical protein [Tanacetum cinerariifolium]